MSDLAGSHLTDVQTARGLAPALRPSLHLTLCLAIGLGLGACETMSGAWQGTKNTVSDWFESDDAPADGEAESSESAADSTASAPSSPAPASGGLSSGGMATGSMPGMGGGSGAFRSTAAAPSLASVPSEAPKPPSTVEDREEAVEGLVGDRERAQYSDQGGRQNPMVVRPLGAAIASSSPADASAPQTARAPDAVPAQPVAPRTTALAERLGAAPPPPPPPAGGAAPAPTVAPAPTPAPQALRPTSPAPAAPAPASGALIAAPRPMPEVYGDETIVIDGAGTRGGGLAQQLATAPVAVAPRAAFDPGSSSVSSQIGTVSFAPGSTRLSPTARAVLADVAQLRADVDGAVRIEARGAEANARAVAISTELKRLGVPAGRLYAGSSDGIGDETDLYLDY